MKNKKRFNPKGFLLLMLYVFSLGPTLLFHHHPSDIVDFSKADACEKAIYYGVNEGDCHHKLHLNPVKSNCQVCSHHLLLSPQLLPDVEITLENPVFTLAYFSNYQGFYFSEIIHFQNKAPPFA
ncbi:MAG: hypothetical protein WDA08_03155 [Weeksellaceae bacterium]